MIIGLYGIYGVYNFGCEAIVRGAVQFAKSVYPDCRIRYFTFSEEYDTRLLRNLDLEVVPVVEKRTLSKRAINKAYKVLHVPKRAFMFDADSIIDGVDMLISIGGDIYTIPQIRREQMKYEYYNPLVDFCDRVIAKGKKVIVYGASVGPWGRYQKAIDYNVKALKKYKAILCREEKSIEYLQSLGMNNAMFFPDPAFQVRKGNLTEEKKYIGINLSPLSLEEIYGSTDDAQISKLAGLLDRLCEETGHPIMLIPHVLSESPRDNDLLFLEKIQKNMQHSNQTVFADFSRGFLGLKEDISKCFLVAAARMHCAVNAVDENIPAVFLAYSQKAVGMCKYVYGDTQNVIDLRQLDEKLIERIQYLLPQCEAISDNLKKRNAEISEYYQKNLDRVREYIQ